MSELMGANLFRLRRDKVFWACAALPLFLAAAVMANGCRQYRAMAAEGYVIDIAGVCFRLVPVLAVSVAVFTGLYLGTDHSEGALRNRLMVGRSRERVYLSELGTAMTAALAFAGAWLLGCGGVALLNRDLWQMGAGQTALLILLSVGGALALASMVTVVGMLTEMKSTSAVVSILVVMGLLMASTWLYSRLQEPEMESGLIITAAGMEWGEPTPNLRYVGGLLRQVFEGILNVLPTGQMVLLADMAVAHPVRDIIASAAVTAAAVLTGIALFRKKDLK